MTAATVDIQVKQSGTPEEIPPGLRAFPMAAAVKCPANTLVGLDSSGNAGPADGTTYTTVVGWAERGADNSSGLAAAINVTVRRGVAGGWAVTGTAVTKAKVGLKIYAVDNQTLSLTATSNAFAGYVDEIKDGVPYYSIGLFPQGT